jgi:hypothetical protein
MQTKYDAGAGGRATPFTEKFRTAGIEWPPKYIDSPRDLGPDLAEPRHYNGGPIAKAVSPLE